MRILLFFVHKKKFVPVSTVPVFAVPVSTVSVTTVPVPIVPFPVVDDDPVIMSDDEIKNYIEREKAKTTEFKDVSDLNICYKYCKSIR